MKKSTKTGLFYLGMVLFYIYIARFFIELIPKKYFTVNFSYVFGQITIIIPIVLYLLITKGKIIKDIPFKKIKIENAIILVIFAYVCLPIVSFLNAITMLFSTNYVASTVGSLQNNPLIINVLMIALLPACCEELAFRGIIYNGLRKNGIFAAILLSGLAFGLYHMNINQFVYAFLLGCVFTLINEASGSILGSMIIHFVFNLNTVISIEFIKLLPYLQKLSGANNNIIQKNTKISTDLSALTVNQKTIILAFYGVLAIGATALNIYIFKWYTKRNGKEEHIKEIFRNKLAGFKDNGNGKILSIPLVLAYVICIAIIVLRN